MNTSAFIARHLKFSQTISIVAVALSFFIITVAVTIASGFRTEIRRGLSEISGDIQVGTRQGGQFDREHPVSLSEPWVDSVRAMSGVSSVRGAVYLNAIATGGNDIQGVMVKGVPMDDDTTALGVRIPRTLSRKLNLSESDRMLTYFVGDRVQARNFTVTQVYDAMSDSQDNIIVLAHIEDIQRLCGWDSDQVSCVEVLVRDDLRERASLEAVALDVMVASQIMTTDIYSRYPALFDWLNLIDTNVTAILLLMILVAAFNMISGLLIMLLRNISTIGALKAFGMTDKGVAKVFLNAGARVVAAGMAAGNAAALLFCLLQKHLHLIKLDSASYFLSEVPVHADVFRILICDAAAFAAIELLLLLPCIFITRVDPAETLRRN